MNISFYPLAWSFSKANGVNGQNSLARVRIRREAPHPTAVLAQELYEHWHKRRWLGLPYFWAVIRGRESRIQYLEEMELMGHAIEAEFAAIGYQADVKRKRLSEARAMISPVNSYRKRGLFEDMDSATVATLLEIRSGDALGWINRNRSTLERVAEKLELDFEDVG